ncbi:ATG8-interacting protein 1 isoform X2 [Cicer arietinum]|nr:ATG8-interacting protein 1 isoform X2 [Cicer arietinum]XP_012569162.1 ATG8-interacting protein 1 isoform X2 [Cicer arietinum]
MAGTEDEGEKASRGNEWEVVSLTASTYAAAPGPDEVELKDDDKEDTYAPDEAETSNALFMSGHFAFPPSQHENLPLEPDYGEIHNESVDKDIASEDTHEEATRPSGKDEENLTFAGLDVSEEFEGMQYYDEKINRLSVQGKQFEEGTTLPDFGLTEKEDAKYTSFHSETTIDAVTAYGESIVESETIESAEQETNVSPDLSLSKNSSKDDKHKPSNIPCGAWWKRRAASIYAHAKEANTLWSVFIAATVMGLVMLGQRWQQEKALQLKWQISITDEARSRVLAPMIRLKDVIIGGHRRGSFIRESSSAEI